MTHSHLNFNLRIFCLYCITFHALLEANKQSSINFLQVSHSSFETKTYKSLIFLITSSTYKTKDLDTLIFHNCSCSFRCFNFSLSTKDALRVTSRASQIDFKKDLKFGCSIQLLKNLDDFSPQLISLLLLQLGLWSDNSYTLPLKPKFSNLQSDLRIKGTNQGDS